MYVGYESQVAHEGPGFAAEKPCCGWARFCGGDDGEPPPLDVEAPTPTKASNAPSHPVLVVIGRLAPGCLLDSSQQTRARPPRASTRPTRGTSTRIGPRATAC